MIARKQSRPTRTASPLDSRRRYCRIEDSKLSSDLINIVMIGLSHHPDEKRSSGIVIKVRCRSAAVMSLLGERGSNGGDVGVRRAHVLPEIDCRRWAVS
jgi:hypothetical protein